MINHLSIWYPLFLFEIAVFLAACNITGSDPKPKPFFSQKPSSVPVDIPPAGHGRSPKTLAFDVTGIPDTPLSDAPSDMPRRKSIPHEKKADFEPHLRRQEEDFIRNLSVKMTMRRRRGSEDIRFKVEVILRDRVVMRSFFDMITEDDDDNS